MPIETPNGRLSSEIPGEPMGANTNFDTTLDLASAIEALRSSEQRLAVVTEALRKSEEREIAGRLALEVMHEIRNPLEALGHLNYLAFEQAADSERVRKYMTLAQEQMENLSHIAKQTLAFVRQSDKP